MNKEGSMQHDFQGRTRRRSRSWLCSRWQRRGAWATNVSVHPAKGSSRRPHFRNRIPRSWCSGIFIYVWL